MTSISYMNLQTTHPALVADLRRKLGVEEDKEEEEEGPKQKRARVG
jgi:hypothetical protein